MDFQKENPLHTDSSCGHDNCMLCRMFGRVHSWKTSGQILWDRVYQKGQEGTRFLIQGLSHGYQQFEQRIIMRTYTSNFLAADVEAAPDKLPRSPLAFQIRGIKRFIFFWTALLLLFYVPQLIIIAFVFDLVFNVLMPFFHVIEKHQECVQQNLNQQRTSDFLSPAEPQVSQTESATRPASPVTFTADQPPASQNLTFSKEEVQILLPCSIAVLSGVPQYPLHPAVSETPK